MTFANVNIGSYAGDNTGDPLRTAFDKINRNFANITAGNVSVTLNAPVMSVAGRTGNIVLSVNDVSGAVGLGRLSTTVNAANVAANAYTDAAISNLVNGAPLALNTLQELADQLSDDTSAIAAITVSLDQTTNNQNAANVLVYALDSRVGNVETSVSENTVSINLLNVNAAVQALEINSINSNVTAINVAIDNLDSSLTSTNTEITNLWSNAASQATSIVLLTANASAQNNQIADLRANITAANAVIAQHTVDLASLLSNAAGQGTSLDSLVANAAAQSEELDSLIANAASQAWSLTNLTANAAAQGSVFEDLVANAASQSTSIQTLLSNAISQAESLTSLVGNAVTQAESIQTIETNVATLQTQVYSDSNTQSYLDSVGGNIVPSTDVTYDLGSTDKRWKDLYLSDSTIYIGNTSIGSGPGGITSSTGFDLGDAVAQNLTANEWVYANLGVETYQIQFTDAWEFDSNTVNIMFSEGDLVYESTAGTSGGFRPSINDSESLGKDGYRWAQVYANLVNANNLTVDSTSELNVVNVASEVNITDITRLYRVDTDTVAIETFSNLNLTSPGRVWVASGGNIELDTAGTGNVVITSGGIVLPDGSYLTTASTIDLGNIRFSGDSITSSENGDRGITINASGYGEVVVSDNLGINNINPAYTLDIGNINENENTGAIGINFNNNVESVGHRYGSALVGWDWWDQNGHGTNNDGTEHYRFGIYNGNVAPFSHAWLSFDQDAPANSIVVDAVGAVTVKKMVSNTIKSNVQVRHTEVEPDAPLSTEPIDVITATQWIHTANTTQDFAFNIRGNSSVTLNDFLGSGDTIAVQYTVTNGDTAFYCTDVAIDGTSQSVKWLQGVAPSAGTINGHDLYNFIITKISTDTYIVLGQQQKYS